MYDILSAKYLKDYLIELEFSNLVKGIVDFSEYTNRGGLFNSLAEMDFFRKFYINNDIGTICWENGLDIAPDSLYSKINNNQF